VEIPQTGMRNAGRGIETDSPLERPYKDTFASPDKLYIQNQKALWARSNVLC
jgi:hypothetical protein